MVRRENVDRAVPAVGELPRSRENPGRTPKFKSRIRPDPANLDSIDVAFQTLIQFPEKVVERRVPRLVSVLFGDRVFGNNGNGYDSKLAN
jgi:hypothetical protein